MTPPHCRKLPVHSAIYRGSLRHRRFHPLRHKFSYSVFMMYLDLDELDAVFEQSPWWSKKPWRPARFERSDFLGDPQIPLDQAVRNRIFEEVGEWHKGPIRMLANLRYFGFIINPITCYYCFDENEKLQTIVTEVTNTPWSERISYVLKCDPQSRIQRISFQKGMHVSPFNPMDMTYRWSSNKPSKILSLNLETEQTGEKQMDATMVLKRQEINAGSLAGILVEHPWMTAKVVASIYWQALILAIKKAPFFSHPKYLES
ncbi:MAG: DUF1365 domain-containing protein [Gammaproteobacteria bacterium]|nr:DUF1365 domain-containing protein [Gammaproteobacteria bacterium]